MNKKASLMDSIYVPLYLLVIAITIIIAGYTWSQISHTIEPVMNQTVNNTRQMLNDIDVGFSAMDYMFPVLIAGMLLVSLIFAFKSGSNVIYAILSFVVWVFAIFISVIFSNVFEQFTLTLTNASTDYPIIYYVMTNIKWVVLGWVFLISLVMFTRNKRDDDSLKYQQETSYYA